MPRVSNAEKLKSRRRILDAASAQFREKGIEATSLSDVMKAAGMTHGGFYRHFTDKDELVAAAFRNAVDDLISEIEALPDRSVRDRARADYIATYLSQDHVDRRAAGCPLAALGSELARVGGGTRTGTAEAVDRVATFLGADGVPAGGYALLSLLVGAVTLARLADDPAQSQAILDAARAAAEKLTPAS
ncbi:TetR/AcrR family transcriptional regulator [Aestuariicoccus sp. MJ-SS9]|uniref:TetR/AcrR family transcriptional regulator n=1 Tax=Aestuariicoccus sp. MJ-SS9 TaxID=3079855 RepID=UPI002907835D|nr:TetR family transcriptional regulator [Aestuariicoccus sp. MJ-SS9]MDU8913180.1 TetR family transcriptional regulator [Aestuariicoccus sp. MJ-SS9]